MPSPAAYETLKTYFGYDSFYPYQKEVIDALAEGSDVLAVIATGAGKSLCYQVPAMLSGGLTLVISPLIALMKDQVDGLRECGVPAACINSTQEWDERKAVERAVTDGSVRILYVSPERAVQQGFVRFLQGAGDVTLIAVDEAHCISQWGHEFRPEYRQLAALIREFPTAPVVALTATATPAVRTDIMAQLRLRQPIQVVGSFYRPNLRYEVRPREDTFGQLLNYLKGHRTESGIIYTMSRSGAEELAERLRGFGIRAFPYHAGLSKLQRERTQEKFIRDDAEVVVATVAFGMGIDKPDVRYVVHVDMPRSLEYYYQETGRAGRDGDPADCILFYSPGDRGRCSFFIEQEPSQALKQAGYRKLDGMVEYAEATECRAAAIVRYFGETLPAGGCGQCDNCRNPRERFDGTPIARTALACVNALDVPYGAGHIIEILRGQKTKKIRETGGAHNPAYGKGKAHSREEWRGYLRDLIRQGYLEVGGDRYPVLTVTAAGHEVLTSDEAVVYLTRPARGRRKKAEKMPALTGDDGDLFEDLRTLRKEIADREGVPPYCIFHDATLREIACARPQSEEELLAIRGIGKTKLARFGTAFLDACRTKDGGREGPSASAMATLVLFRQGKTIRVIGKERDLTDEMVAAHIEECIGAGIDLPLDDLVPAYRQEAIRDAARREGTDDLRFLKAVLGDRYPYAEIRLVLAAMKASERQEG
ncbi:MAG TPA: DNA helicase RecQ [Methanoculleus sp.]|nr:DNA helicase RecQ [Methanoculleus sp.]